LVQFNELSKTYHHEDSKCYLLFVKTHRGLPIYHLQPIYFRFGYYIHFDLIFYLTKYGFRFGTAPATILFCSFIPSSAALCFTEVLFCYCYLIYFILLISTAYLSYFFVFSSFLWFIHSSFYFTFVIFTKLLSFFALILLPF